MPSTADAVYSTSDFHQQSKALVLQRKSFLALLLNFLWVFGQEQISRMCSVHVKRLSVSQTLMQCVTPSCWSYADLTFFYVTLTTCIDAAEIMFANYCIISAYQLEYQSCSNLSFRPKLPDSLI